MTAARLSGALALGALLSFLAVLPAHAEKRVEMLSLLLESAKGPEQVRLISALGRTDSADAVKPLLKQFQFRAGRPAVSLAVIRALGRLGRKEAVGPLTDAWDHLESLKLRGGLSPGQAQMRAAIVEALGRVNDGKGTALVLAAVGDDDPAVSAKAVEACGRLREKKAVPLLLDLAEREPGSGDGVYEALGEINDSRARPLLEKAAKGDDPAAMAQASFALARMGDRFRREDLRKAMTAGGGGREALLPAFYLARLDEKDGLDHLVALARDRQSPLAETAAALLARSANAGAVPPMSETLGKSQEPFLRLLAVKVLSGVGGPKAESALAEAARDRDAQVAAAARAALAELGGYDD